MKTVTGIIRGVEPSQLHYQAAQAAARILHEAGYEAFIIGGAVRDILLGEHPKDFDLATNASPEEILKLPGFEHSQYQDTAQAYGVTRVHVAITDDDGAQHQPHLEIATYRRDIEAHLGRKQTKVAFSTLEDDVKRRDLTINALALDPDVNQVVDLVNGIDDLDNRIVRMVGEPEVRLQEDPLRLLRAIRFKNQLGFEFAASTETAIKQATQQQLPRQINPQRIAFELSSMLMHRNRVFALKDLDRLGVLEQLLPEVAALHGVQQPPELHAEGDVWEHTLLTLQFLPDIVSPQLAWAALLHDIGKPTTSQDSATTGDRIRFSDHHAQGAQIAHTILKRLHFGRRFRNNVAWLVHYHLAIDDLPHMRPGRARQFMSHPAFADLLELHKADAHAAWSRNSNGSIDTSAADFSELEQLWAAFQAESHQRPPSLKQDLGIDGTWLMDRYELPAGPQLGYVLEQLQEAYVDGEIANEEEAKSLIEQLLRSQ